MTIVIMKEKAVYYWERADYEKYKVWLLENNLTHNEFCKKVGFDVSNLSAIVNGSRAMSLKTKRKLEEAGFRI